MKRRLEAANDLRHLRLALNTGSTIPGLGFGTLILDLELTRTATRAALQAGFRLIDSAERYRNEQAVGDGMRAAARQDGVARSDVFVIAKLWNNHHRPERVRPAFEASLSRLGLDYVDLYLIHTPFAFRPGDEQDPRDAQGKVIYDNGVTLNETWAALEELLAGGRCRAIGLSDFSIEQAEKILRMARVRPAVIQVESHPYLPQWEMLEFCQKNGIVLLAFAPLGHGMKPGPLEEPTIRDVSSRTGKTPAQVLLAWALQRGTAVLTTPKTASRARENFDVSLLPEEAITEINRITTRSRYNPVVETGAPGFIPQGS